MNNNIDDEIEKEEDFTLDRKAKYLLQYRRIVGVLIRGLELNGFPDDLDEIFDMLPANSKNEELLEFEGIEYGGVESMRTNRDILFTIKVDENNGLKVNIEMERQIDSKYDLAKRAMVYACQNLLEPTIKLPSSEDEEENIDDYEKIQRVYTIWLCMKDHISGKNKNVNNTSKGGNQCIHKYQMAKNNPNGMIYDERLDFINIIFIEIGKLQKLKEAYERMGEDKSLVDEGVSNDFISNVAELFKMHTNKELEQCVDSVCNMYKYKPKEKGEFIMRNILTLEGLEQELEKERREKEKERREKERERREKEKERREKEKARKNEEKARKNEEKAIKEIEELRSLLKLNGIKTS